MVVIFIKGGLNHLWGVGGGYETSSTRQTEDCEGMGNPQENGSFPLGMNQDESSNTFATWIRALFDRLRLQRNGGGGELENDPTLPNLDKMGQEQTLSLVKCLTE